MSRFPFSWIVGRVIEATRKPIESAHSSGRLGFPDLHKRVSSSCRSIFGNDICAAWGNLPRDPDTGMSAYLHDRVSMTAPRFSGLSFEDLCSVYRGVLVATGVGVSDSPETVHPAIWNSEHRLYNICSTLSRPCVPAEVCASLLGHLAAGTSATLEELDTSMARLLVESVQAPGVMPDFAHTEPSALSEWLRVVGAVEPSLTPLFASLAGMEEGAELEGAWRGVVAARAYLEQVLIPWSLEPFESHETAPEPGVDSIHAVAEAASRSGPLVEVLLHVVGLVCDIWGGRPPAGLGTMLACLLELAAQGTGSSGEGARLDPALIRLLGGLMNGPGDAALAAFPVLTTPAVKGKMQGVQPLYYI